MKQPQQSLIAAVILVVVIALAGFFFGRTTAPTEILDEEVVSEGIGASRTSRTLSAAVKSLSKEGRMVVFSYRGCVIVEQELAKAYGLLQGRQSISIPGEVYYFIPMEGFSEENVVYDEQNQQVTITLPSMKLGNVAFLPEKMLVNNKGLLTYSDDVVQRLMKENFETARRAFIKQAQEKVWWKAHGRML